MVFDLVASFDNNSRPLTLIPVMDPMLCLREDAITELIGILDAYYVAHVRGTPTSGKSTMARLLRDHLEDAGRKVVFVRSWPPGPRGEDYATVLVDVAKPCLSLDPKNLGDHNDTVFIIDEAQQTYIHTNFWLEFIKERSGSRWGTKVCLFASYGSPTTGPVDYPDNSAPVYLGFPQRVGITPSLVDTGPQFGLFYTMDEFEDVLKRHNEYSTTPLPLSAEAKLYLFRMTNGHPGAVDGLIGLLQMVLYHLAGCLAFTYDDVGVQNMDQGQTRTAHH